MIANNSSGTHSVIYGKTIDHVARAEGRPGRRQRRPTAGRSTAEALEAKCSQPDLEGACYRAVRRLAAEHAGEIERRYPEDPAPRRRLQPRRLRSRPASRRRGSTWPISSSARRGRSAGRSRRSSGWSSCPGPRRCSSSSSPTCSTRWPRRRPSWPISPAAVEVVDRYVLDSTKLNPEAARLRDFLRGDPGAILIDRVLRRHARRARRRGSTRSKPTCAAGASATSCVRATDPAEQARIWKLRTLALGLSMAEKGDAKAISFVEDTAVAPEHLRDYIAEFLEIIARHGTRAGVYAHASVGCLHVRPVIDLKTAEGVRRFEAIAAEVADLVLKYGGALSGEHGDGLVRSPFQEKMYGPVLYQAFRELKRTFDPHGLLNPGKIVDAPPLTTNLRYGPGYVTPEVPTTFDFSADGGLLPVGRAVRRRRRVPQDARGDDVPVVPGDARRTRQHPRPGQRAAAGADRPARLRGPDRPGPARGARPLPGVQGVQERMPDQRRHGPAQGRVPASVSSRARPAAAQPRVRPRRQAQPLGLPARAGVELGGAEPGRSAG